jgi:hypothetical protein
MEAQGTTRIYDNVSSTPEPIATNSCLVSKISDDWSDEDDSDLISDWRGMRHNALY